MSNVATTYWQAGLQSVIGTPVAATRRIYDIAAIPEEKRNKEYVQQSRQNFVENFDVVETHVIVEKFPWKGVLNYEEYAWWAETHLKGGVSPTGAGPYTRVYDGQGSTDDLKPVTFEGQDDVGAFQIPDALVQKWSLSGKGGNKPGVVEMSLDMFASRVTAGHTMTGALSDRDLTGHYIPFKQAQFYLDDSAGGIGGTEIGTLTEFKIEGDIKRQAEHFGGDSGYFGLARRENRHVSFMVVIMFDATSYSEFSTNFQNNVARFGQLKFTGAGNDSLTWNFHTKFDTFEFPEDGATRKVALMGKSVYDATLGYDWQATLINDVASI